MQGAKKYIIIVGIVLGVLLIAGFILAGIFGVLLDVLYIALIVLAVVTLLSTALLIYAIIALIQTITTVRNEMKPLLASVQETVGVVKETAKNAGQTATTIGSTAKLTSEFALAPSVRAAATVLAGQQMLRVFLGKGRVRSRVEERRKQQLELLDSASAAGGE